MISLKKKPFSPKQRIRNIVGCGLIVISSAFSPFLASPVTAGESELSPQMVRGIEAFHYGDLSAAKALFSDHLDNYPEDEIAHMYLARSALISNDIDLAKQAITKALEIDGQNEEIAFRYGEIMGRAAQQANRVSALSLARLSLEGFERAIELNPKNILYRKGLMRFHLEAPGIAGGKKEKAVEQAAFIKKLEPYEGIFALLEVYDELDDHESYQETLEKALEDFPKDADLYIKLGKFKENQNQASQAITHFDRAYTLAEEHLAHLGPGLENESEEETRNRLDAVETLFHAKFQQGRMRAVSGNDLDGCVNVLHRFIEEYPNRENIIILDWALWYLASCHEQKAEFFRADHIHTLLKNVTSEPNIRRLLNEKHGLEG